MARESLRETLDTLQKAPSALLPDRWNKYLLEMLETYTDDARPAVRSGLRGLEEHCTGAKGRQLPINCGSSEIRREIRGEDHSLRFL